MMSHWVLATVLCYAASLAGYVTFLATSHRGTRGRCRYASCTGARIIVVHYPRAGGSFAFGAHGSLQRFVRFAVAIRLAFGGDLSSGLELFHRQRAVGAFVLPVVLAVFAVAQAVHGSPATPLSATGPLLAWHITLNVAGYAAFALSFVLSLIYLLENNLLRNRRLGSIVWRFPALEVLERMSRSSVVVGLAFARWLGIAFGFLWMNRIYGHVGNWNGDPKETVTLAILGIYAGYLWLGRTKAWRGARASALCVFNFLFVLFSYSIVNLYLSDFHRLLLMDGYF